MHTEPNQSLDALLGQLGPSEGGLQIVRLDGLPQPEHLRYADLIKPPPSDTPRPGAVVEMEAQPVLYAIAATEVTELPRLQRLHWTLTCRHDADYLAVLEPGRLTLHRLGLFDALPSPRVLDIAQIGDLMSLRSTLALIHKPTDTEPSQDLSDALFALFHRTVDALVGIGLDDALSLTGRALFLRFLLDRGIIVEADRQKICPSSARLTDAFANPVVAAETCSWLNQTFNGDLLPLPAENLLNWFRSLERDASNARVFSELSNIMHKAPNGQLRFDCSWAALDFGHIPVGLLSQVYEQHSHRHSPWARSESVYYTPRRIAEYMLDEVFANLEQPSAARVLDPAVGAGVFLVVAFRRLAEARWRCDDSRPGTRELREILYQQLTGFDISEAALRLTALSLYLTALELDPDPKPHSALKFSHLRGRVLFDVCEAGTRGPGRAGLPPLGSLGRQVGPEHDGKYDVVVGNPPWTAWKTIKPHDTEAGESPPASAAKANQDGPRTAQKTAVEETVRSFLVKRLGAQKAREYEMVDFVPDLPFCFLALKWAKPHGRVALAVHARLLFKRDGAGRRVRELLFQAAKVTGILNGAALRNTKVWPQIEAPFCLLFAENIASQPNDAFYLVSPQLEDALNRRGRIRIDARATQPIERRGLEERPDLPKILFRGGSLDFAVMEKIQAAGGEQLDVYWQRLGLTKGQGYQIGGEARKARRKERPQMKGLLKLDKDADHLVKGAFVLPDSPPLERFTSAPVLLEQRSRDLYRAPLVLMRESPRADLTDSQALLAFEDVGFVRSYYGFSCYGHSQAELLARYLLLLLNSEIPIYCALMQSSKFGVEREVLHLEDVSALSVRPLETLSATQRAQIMPLADGLIRREANARARVSQFCAELYGLNRWDREVIADTMAMSLPFSANRKDAQARPTADDPDTERFRARVESGVSNLARYSGLEVAVEKCPETDGLPWQFFSLTAFQVGMARPLPRAIDSARLARFTQTADWVSASQILCHEHHGELLIGIVAQRRYLTATRARECAQEIIWEHLDTLLAPVRQ